VPKKEESGSSHALSEARVGFADRAVEGGCFPPSNILKFRRKK